MRPPHRILSRHQVHRSATIHLRQHIPLGDSKRKVTAPTLWAVLLVAAAEVTSLHAAYGRLDGLASEETIRKALDAALLEFAELQRQLNAALAGRLPRSLRRRRQRLAIDLTPIPDHGAPPLGYVVPTDLHLLGRILPIAPYERAGYVGLKQGIIQDNASYLGVACLLLMVAAVVLRGGIRRAWIWWGMLGVLVLSTMGAECRLGPIKVELPGRWLWEHVPIVRLIRSPARLNHLTAVVAARLAAEGLRRLLDRIDRPARRAAVVIVVAVADLARIPPIRFVIVSMPEVYRVVSARSPSAGILELPLQSSVYDLGMVAGLDRLYWQSLHRCRTSAGRSGIVNLDYDRALCQTFPFPSMRPDYLADPASMTENFGNAHGAESLGAAWLFLTAHGFDYLIVHKLPPPFGGTRRGLMR